MAMNHKVSVSEMQDAEAEIMKWQNEVAKVDAKILHQTSKDYVRDQNQKIIPVRGAKQQGATEFSVLSLFI